MIAVKLTTALVIVGAVCPAGAYAMTDPPVPAAPKAEPEVAVPAQLQDLRSPDARDLARQAAIAPVESASARVSHARSAPSASDGFEWGDAGIGAAVVLAMGSVAGGTLLLVGRSRQRTPTT
jgi:hypothetical protein